jgi:hypothetical protein
MSTELIPALFGKAGFPPADVERIASAFCMKAYAKDDHFNFCRVSASGPCAQ